MAEPSKEAAKKQRILIFAGEASGDAYGALLLEHLRHKVPSVEAYGGGGISLLNAGLHSLYTTEKLSVMGLVEVLSIIPTLFGIKKTVLSWAAKNKPACAVFIDYPGFHVPLAKKIKALGIPVLYYISPKVWAYREKRITKVIRSINQLASIFTFEKELYHRYGFDNTQFVGHPIVDVLEKAGALKVVQKDHLVGLLPGSRSSEIARLLPPMIAAARILKAQHPQLHFWLSCVPHFDDAYYQQVTADFDIEYKRENLHHNIAQSAAIMGASGTVNLEIAYLGIPAVITYRLAALTHAIALRFIKIPYASPDNIIMNECLYPELLQDNCTPENLSAEIESLLFDTDKRKRQQCGLALFKEKLGTPGANERVAEMVITLGNLRP